MASASRSRPYEVHPDFGGNGALERLRARSHSRGTRLLLDFVPNHTAPDDEWVRTHRQYYVCGTEEQFEQEPRSYTRVEASDSVLAYGRDPHFAGWPDTLQLNYANPELQDAMASELENVAELCDGVRCEMPILALPDVFEKTWGHRPAPFWPHAIARVRARHPKFLFVSEAYWDLEWTLQQQSFDYTQTALRPAAGRKGAAGARSFARARNSSASPCASSRIMMRPERRRRFPKHSIRRRPF